MRFSYDGFNNRNNRPDDKIIILKRVKSLRQLKNSEKEWVRLCYKESILKGFTIVNDIQCYIASKTKIWIERIGIEYLKKSEEEENKRWYYNLAKDHFAYVGVHRKAIDELGQYKKELWSMMTDPDATNMEKVQITKELHNLTKTYTLLLRDLPFVTNLSKYYNLKLADPHYNKTRESQNIETNKTHHSDEKEIIEQKVSERLKKMIDESGFYMKGDRSNQDILRSDISDKKITDDVMESMRKQLNCSANDILESINNKDYQESIRKIKEILDD